MKVQLFRPPFDEWYRYGDQQLEPLQSPPTNLAILEASLRKAGVYDTEIIDGFRKPLEYCLDKIDADIVGATDNYSYHLNSLSILKKAKEKGATTVIGGQNVRPIAERILKNHEYVDFAVVGDGEIALPLLAQGGNPEIIPNLVYRHKKEIKINREISASLDTLFDFDKVVDFEPDTDKAVIISSIRGCVKAEDYGRCDWCIMRDKLRIMDVDLVWQQIKILNEKYSYKFMWESGDSFYVGDLPDRLLKARPDDLKDITFRVYLNPDNITKETAATLHTLNMRWSYIGIDEINDGILTKTGKGTSNRKNIENAWRLFADLDPQPPMHTGFLIGLPGETHETAEEKVKFAYHLAGMFDRIGFFASLPVPWPGTRLYEKIRRHPQARAEYPGDMDNDDFFDYAKLVQIQTKYFTSDTYEHLLDCISRIKKTAKPSDFSSSYFVQGQ